MEFRENLNGEISSESGSSVTYLPIMRSHQIEPASPIAIVRLSDLGYGNSSSSPSLSTHQVVRRPLCDTHT